MVNIKRQKVRPHRKKKVSGPRPRRNFKSVLKFIFWACLVGCVGAGIVGFQYLFVDSDLFNVRGLDVRFYDGNNVLRRESFSGIDDKKVLGTNIFLVDLKNFKERIENEHPELKDVVVRRALPSRLIVQARKRQPAAQIYDGRAYLLDREGVFLPDATDADKDAIPLITGIRISGFSRKSDAQREKINKALLLINAASQNNKFSNYSIKKIDMADSRSISFYLNARDAENVEIKIGDSEFTRRLEVLATVLEQLGRDIERVKYIDLRFEDPIVGPR